MSIDEALDVTRIYSVADQLPADTPETLNSYTCYKLYHQVDAIFMGTV
jgi:hypothetical protein